MALPLPELPSIAVLPFVNMSEDPKQELLCDAITDNIINALSKVPRLFVIARNSTFTYKRKAAKVKQVSEELGVRYVLEGSVQRSGDRVRITAQLVDALKGNLLFAERYDNESTGLFDLQDDITSKVLTAVRMELASREVSESIQYFRGKNGLDCQLKSMEAWGYVQRMTIADTNLARKIAEEALGLCPEVPFYHVLASVNLNDYLLGSAKSPRESIEKATELLQKILAIDDSYVEAHALSSNVYTIRKEYDKAIAEGARAVNLDPGSPWALFWYAATLTNAGKPEEAIPLFEKAIRLNPLGPGLFYGNFGAALRDTGRLEEAVVAYRKALDRAPNNFRFHAALAAVFSMMGRAKEAYTEAAEVLRINPKFSLEWYAKTSLHKDQSTSDKIINAMRKAGLPDKPPPAQP
jgi:adenylate cyclase